MKKIFYVCAVSLVITMGSALKSSAQHFDNMVPPVPEIYFENPDEALTKCAADSTKKQAIVLNKEDKKMAVVDVKKNRKERRKVEAKKEE
jgi:UDP-N-acetylmuramyl pentapeptide synthase